MQFKFCSKTKKINLSIIYLVPIIVFIFIIVLLIMPGKSLALDSESISDFNSNWTLISDNSTLKTISLPIKINTDEPVVISKIIPDDIEYPMVLGFRTAHQKLKIFCNEELIYSFGYDNFSIFAKSPGSAYNLVRLPKECTGETLTIEFFSPYAVYNGDIPVIHNGSKAALVFSLLRTHIFSVLITVVIFIAGVVTLMAYYFIIRKDSNVTKETIYLGLFAIFVSIWLFGECRLTQFFFIPPAVNTCITFIAMLATPIPLVKYIACGQYVTKRKLLNVLSELLSLLMVICILLQAFNAFDFIEQLPYINFSLFVTGAVLLYAVLSDALQHKNHERNQLLISVGILILFFVIETVILYSGGKTIGGMMSIGVLIFIAMQAQAAFKKASAIMHLSHLASVDALTSCLNRTMYNQMISDCDGQKEISIVIADINILKLINDNYGHTVGDEAIVNCANHFTNTFSSYGSCFRIGGDEFAMIGKNISEQRLIDLCEDMHLTCKLTSSKVSYPFSISLGFAIFNNEIDHSLLDTIRRADKNMYENKRLSKQPSNADTANR